MKTLNQMVVCYRSLFVEKKYTFLHWHRRIITIITVFILLLVSTLPASAIVYGEPDGNAHPFVGSIVVRIPGEGLFQFCSGTLIAANVFLTASHCTAPLDSILAENPGSEVLVTFDSTITEGGTFYTGTWHTNPAYLTGNGESDTHDVAVIVLDQAPGITPAQLPTAGLLDELKAGHVLKDTLFTVVGYGAVRETNRTGFQGILDNLERRRADQEFLSLTNAWLTLSMNFIHLDGEETSIVASITVTGDAVCKATDTTYRMDTESARSFLANYVTLP
jgi:hypothetical protein